MRRSPRPRTPILLGGIALAGLSGLVLSPLLAKLGVACPSFTKEEATIPLDFGGGQTAQIRIRVTDFDELGVPEEDRPEDACHAWVQAALSVFPSVESRYGTARIADAIAETVIGWKEKSCSVAVVYENDVDADFPMHELCRAGRYGFEEGRVRSIGSETFC